MRAPRGVVPPLGWQVDGNGGQSVLLCVNIEGTGRTVELRAPLTTVADSGYIRAAVRFEAAKDEGCKAPVKLTATPESEWCPAAVLRFLDTGKIDPPVYSSQRALLLLLEYADYLCVDALVDGCLQCLMTMHMQRIEYPPHWSTVTYFMRDEVSDAVSNSPFWPGACNLARLQALEAMQDLEHVLSTVDGCKRLMTLSYKVFLELCRCCGTKVAYESTIVAAITLWYAAHPWASASELYELASTVCLRSLPRMYAATVLPQLPWWQQVIPEGTLLQAAELLSQASIHCSEEVDGGSSHQPTGDTCQTRSNSKLSLASSRRLRLALDGLLLNMDKQRRNLYRLLLREPRGLSRLHQLHLTAALTEQQLQKAYAGTTSSNSCSGRWHGTGGWQTFAGINWQLTCSFVPSGSQRHQRWHLAVGVRFSVSGVVDPSAVSLHLPLLHLNHRRAVASSPPLTRLQLGQRGVHPAAAGHLVPAGAVLPCQEWLPLGLTGTDWGPHNMTQISRYLDNNESIQLDVTISNIL